MAKSALLLTLFFLLGTSPNATAAPRMVVAELFTNTSCPPCRPAGLTLNQIAVDCSAYLAVIRYHTWWPGSWDPFYRANMPENRARTLYYGTNYVPRLMIDGIVDGEHLHPYWRSLIDDRATIPSPLRIVVTAHYESKGRNARAVAKIYNETTSDISGRLHFVLTETGIPFTAPNGSTVHNQVMHDMIPNADGEAVTIRANDSITRTRDFVIRDTTWLNPPSNTLPHYTVYESCHIVVFVQDPTTREIYQGGKARLTPAVGIEEVSKVRNQSSKIEAFPNPFITTVHIRALSPQIRVYDACGNLVKTFSETNVIWDAREMRPGVYFIENENSRVKVLKAGRY